VEQTTVQRRRRMSASARRDQLLDVALEVVVREGFAAVSMQMVAQRAGVSRPVVYEHFGTLQALLEGLIDREMANALEQIDETALGDLNDGDAIELMLDSLGKYLAAVEGHPATWRLVLIPPQGAPESLRRSIEQGQAHVLRSLTNAVRLGSLAGPYVQDPELTARMLSAMADEYARLVLTEPDRYPPERLLLHAGSWLTQMFG
jgi:AcrR family transcriptional regulator